VQINAAGHLLPTTTSTYDLGSMTNAWRDLYLSSGTIYVGPTGTIAADGSGNLQLNGQNGGYVSIGKTTPPAQTGAPYGLDVSGFIDATLISSNNVVNINLRRENPAYPNNGVSGDDILGVIRFLGKDASGNYPGAAPAVIRAYAAQPFTTGNAPGYLTFATAPPNAAPTNFERMRIDQNGNVGIGTTSPIGTLDVSGSARVVYARPTPDDPYGTALELFSDPYGTWDGTDPTVAGYGQFGIQTISDVGSNNQAAFRIRADPFVGIAGTIFLQGVNVGIAKIPIVLNPQGGNVGIGTSAPQAALDVSGRSYFGSTDGSGVVSITAQNGNSYIQSGFSRVNSISGNKNKLIFSDIGANRLTMTMDMSEQQVGIGTTAPQYTLDVSGSVRSGAHIPAANDTYDLGAAGNRWRDLYLSSGSIYLGTNAELTSTGPGNLTITNGGASGNVYDTHFNPPPLSVPVGVLGIAPLPPTASWPFGNGTTIQINTIGYVIPTSGYYITNTVLTLGATTGTPLSWNFGTDRLTVTAEDGNQALLFTQDFVSFISITPSSGQSDSLSVTQSTVGLYTTGDSVYFYLSKFGGNPTWDPTKSSIAISIAFIGPQ
jgi:hypothetical protein